MRTPALTLAAASLVVLALPAEAQWNVERRSGNAIAVATGVDGQIEVGVSCQGNNQVLVPDTARRHLPQRRRGGSVG